VTLGAHETATLSARRQLLSLGAGFYTDVDGGYGRVPPPHSFDNGAPSGNSHPNGGLRSAYAGYNFQTGRSMTGLEGDIEDANNLSGSLITPQASAATP